MIELKLWTRTALSLHWRSERRNLGKPRPEDSQSTYHPFQSARRFLPYSTSKPSEGNQDHNCKMNTPQRRVSVPWTGTPTPGPTMMAIPLDDHDVEVPPIGSPFDQSRQQYYQDLHLRLPPVVAHHSIQSRPQIPAARPEVQAGPVSDMTALRIRFYEPGRNTNDNGNEHHLRLQLERRLNNLPLTNRHPIPLNYPQASIPSSATVSSHSQISTSTTPITSNSTLGLSPTTNTPVSAHDEDDASHGDSIERVTSPTEIALAQPSTTPPPPSTTVLHSQRFIGTDDTVTETLGATRQLFKTWRASHGAGQRRVRQDRAVGLSNPAGNTVNLHLVQRASYPPEYKLKALEFVSLARVRNKDGTPGREISKRQAAKELGVTPKMLRDWEMKRKVIEEAHRQARKLRAKGAGRKSWKGASGDQPSLSESVDMQDLQGGNQIPPVAAESSSDDHDALSPVQTDNVEQHEQLDVEMEEDVDSEENEGDNEQGGGGGTDAGPDRYSEEI